MTRLLNFIRTQERRRGGCVPWNERNEGLYSSGGGNMNEKSFNEG